MWSWCYCLYFAAILIGCQITSAMISSKMDQKNTFSGLNEVKDFYQWKVTLDSQILAKTKCHPIQTFTLFEVFKLCNPSDPYSNIAKCGIPVSLRCNGVTLNYLSSLSNLDNFYDPVLMLAPPFDFPFINIISSIPEVPIYDIARSMQAIPRNDTVAVILLKTIKTSSVSASDHLTSNLDPMTCGGGELTLGGTCAECDYDLVDLVTGEPIAAMTFRDAQPPPCTVTGIETFMKYLNETMYKIASANSRAEFEKGINSLNIVENSDAFIGCNSVIDSLLGVELVPTDIDGNRGCYVSNPASEQYATDPCCNQRLLMNQCCPERTITVNISQLAYINYTKLNQSIPTNQNDSWTADGGFVPSPLRQSLSNFAIAVLNQFVQAKRMSSDAHYGCDAALRAAIPPNYLSDSTQFLLRCSDIIFNRLVKGGKAARCSSDLDCYTSCDKQTHKCTGPTANNSLAAFVACSLDLMSPDVLLLVRDYLGVAAAPADTLPARLAARVQAAVTEPRCYGPDELSTGACIISVSEDDCHTLQSLFPSQDGNMQPDLQLPQISVVGLEANGTATEEQSADEDSDPFSYQFVMFRKDIRNATACLDAGLIWVRVILGGDDVARHADVCRLPKWTDTQDASRILRRGCNTDYGSDCGEDISALERSVSSHRKSIAGPRRARQPFQIRGTLTFRGLRAKTANQPGDFESNAESIRAGETSLTPTRNGTNETNLTDMGDNRSSHSNSSVAALDSTASSTTSAFDESPGTTSAEGEQVGPLCIRRSETDPCGDLSLDRDLWRACTESNYYFKHCGAQPDSEWYFDPSSPCATFTNRLQYAPMDDTLPGMGACKVTNFGFTNGMLPAGYMSSGLINWHSQLPFYEDENFNIVQISAQGTSVAETRCSQVKDAITSMGFIAESSKWFQYDTQTYTYYDPARDDYVDETFPGNQTLCELEKKCNSDVPWDQQLNKTQCIHAYPKEYCGIQIGQKSFIEISEISMCYLPYSSFVVDGPEYQVQCNAYGGTWDFQHSVTDPASQYLCSASPSFSVNTCFEGCEAHTVFDWYLNQNFTSYGVCSTYLVCSIDANYSECTAPKETPTGWVSSYGSDESYPKWMVFDTVMNQLMEGNTNPQAGHCVVAYRSILDDLDYGGEQSLLDSKLACESLVLQIFRPSPENVSGKWSPARALRPRFMDSEPTCKNTCPEQIWDHNSDCSIYEGNYGSCTVSCAGCRALMSNEPSLYGLDENITGGTRSSVCVDSTVNASVCDARTGWKFSLISQICYMTTRAECPPPNQLWSCDLFDSVAGGDEFCSQFQLFGYDNSTILKCVYDTTQACPDQLTCESSGYCDDEFLSDPLLPPWFPLKPACVVPFVYADESGQPNISTCVSDGAVIEMTLGCIYLHSKSNQLYRRYGKEQGTVIENKSLENGINGSNLSTTNNTIVFVPPLTFEQVCTNYGGYLASRARNRISCEMGSERCLRDQQFVQNMDRADCTDERICDPASYSWQPTRTWTSGTWATSDFIATEWVNREWDSVNEFVNTFSFDKMFRLISDSVSRKIQGAYSAYTQCSIGLYSPVFEKLAIILDPNPTSKMIDTLQDIKQTLLVSKTVLVDLSVLQAVGRRSIDLKGVLEQAAAKNKSSGQELLTNISNVTSSQKVSMADVFLYCSSGYVRISQKSLAQAAFKKSLTDGDSLMDTALIQLYIASATQFKDARLEPLITGKAGPNLTKCVTGYAVVQNDQRVIIGQLVGNALSINAAGIGGLPISMCFNADPAIIQCIQKFPVLDVLLFDTRSKQLILRNSSQVTAISNSQYCASNLSAPTTGQLYFPVRRSDNLYPIATVILRIIFSSISDPSLLDSTEQILLKATVSAALPAETKVLPSDVKITSICRADSTGCIVSLSTRRVNANGVVITTTVSTANAGSVSDHTGESKFISAFVQIWNANASFKLSESDLVVVPQGIVQPLAPIVQGSSDLNLELIIQSSPEMPPETSVSAMATAIPDTLPLPTVTRLCLDGSAQCQADQTFAVLAASDQYYPNPTTSWNISWSSVDLQIPVGAWPKEENRPLQMFSVDSRGTIFSSAATNQGAVFAGPITYFTPSGILFSFPVAINLKTNGSSNSAVTVELYRYNVSSGAWERTSSCPASRAASMYSVCGQTGSFSAYAPLAMPVPAASITAGSTCNDGCIAGAVIGSVFGAGLLMFLAYWFVLRPEVESKDGGISTKSAREEIKNQSQVPIERNVPTTDMSKREVRDSDAVSTLQTPAALPDSWSKVSVAEQQRAQDKIERVKAPDDVEYDV